MSYPLGDESLRLMRETGEVKWCPPKGSKIAEFYKNKNVFVTGATGFLGKLLVEKLLRACPDIKSVYLLVRKKKGEDVHERIDKLYSEQVFEPLAKLQPKFQHKISIIKGDISLPGLGISPSDTDLIKKQINVIFHVAATIRFDEKINLATAINVRSTRDLLTIAQKCKNLQSFVYVSTAYSNCAQEEIDEMFYKTPMTAEELIDIVDKVPEKTLIEQTAQIIDGWPNTYTFTKAIAESAVQKYGKGLPVCVVRPAIVTATHKEPLRSWTDNLNGATGILVGGGAGFLKSLHCHKEKIAEIVPGDYVINNMIAASYKTAVERNIDKIPIYNYVSSVENRLTWELMMEYGAKWGVELPTMRAVWYYCLKLNQWYFMHCFYDIFLQLLPAVIMDIGMILSGQRPIMLKIYKKISKYESVIAHFCTNEWKYHNDNTQMLWNYLSSVDKEMFPFSIRELDWEEYFKTHLLGLRMYLLKDDVSTVSEARERNEKFLIAHETLKMVFYFSIIYIVYFVFSIIF